MERVRRGYPSDVTDEEWWCVLPYLLLCQEDAGQREHDLREVFNGLRYVAKTGCQWRWLDAGVFEASEFGRSVAMGALRLVQEGMVAPMDHGVCEMRGRRLGRRQATLTREAYYQTLTSLGGLFRG